MLAKKTTTKNQEEKYREIQEIIYSQSDGNKQVKQQTKRADSKT